MKFTICIEYISFCYMKKKLVRPSSLVSRGHLVSNNEDSGDNHQLIPPSSFKVSCFKLCSPCNSRANILVFLIINIFPKQYSIINFFFQKPYSINGALPTSIQSNKYENYLCTFYSNHWTFQCRRLLHLLDI